VPAWALGEGSPIAEAAQLVAARLAGGESPRAIPLLRPMQGPLKLSYSAIASYETCPRCFYLSQVLGLAEDAGPAMLVGQAAHAALDRFYRAFREADTGESAAPPTADDLVRYGLEELAAIWPRSRAIDPADRDRLEAQLRLYHGSLHDPSIHVLEIEAWSGFGYTYKGVEHRLNARIDRVDQLPDGGVRIVDYKTGRATKRLLSPVADDLQLGVYALAARALLGGGGTGAENGGGGLRGRAEYWLLSTGERGVIDLAEIDEGAVRGKIDGAIDGMLAGRFPRGEKCEGGACAIFGLED
jgi:ATP-dependent helicase/nuclease subunit B